MLGYLYLLILEGEEVLEKWIHDSSSYQPTFEKEEARELYYREFRKKLRTGLNSVLKAYR